VTADADPRQGGESRRDNGLTASSFVPLADIDAHLGPVLLDALGRARIAAYLEPVTDGTRELLYVASGDRGDARTIIDSASRGLVDSPTAVAVPDPLAHRDTDAEFNALISDWHVDTVAAIRAAERELGHEDADWRARLNVSPTAGDEDGDEVEHYVPPPPPPLPRLAAYTVGALALVVLSILVLAMGGRLGLLPGNLSFLLGVGGILVGAGMLVMRLRDQPDEDDDGAVL
jgi:hypothetical protein